MTVIRPPSGPPSAPGLRIGLLGGSFDPPHAGHAHITRWALKALALDRVWWLVSPGNPLKAHGPADMARRLAACRSAIDHPRVAITDIEARLGTRFTADTLARLRARYRETRFVWLMGADNLPSFHRWEDWEWIFETTPIAVFARPDDQLRAMASVAARRYARFRAPSAAARTIIGRSPPCWTLLTGPMSGASSTRIREAGIWP